MSDAHHGAHYVSKPHEWAVVNVVASERTLCASFAAKLQ